MATMKDVARRAGVSTATVSRVINNSAYVEPVTRERVEKAMREFNYHRNAAALALAKRSGNMLGLLTGNLDDPFFSRLARGVEDITRQAGVRLMLCSGGHQAELEKSGLDFLINQGCEAIVAHVTRMGEEELLRYAAHTPALVLVNRYLPTIANRCIWLDNAKAAQAATELLIRQGHRRIACVTTDLPIDDRAQRLAGYRKAMAAAGIDIVGFGRFGQVIGRLLMANKMRITVLERDVSAVGVLRRYGYQVYYGDATELELLRAAGAEKAKSIVITCNEPEDTMEIVRLCQQHFPNLSILARARGRVEAHELLQAGVKQFSRETFSSALELGRKALMELGMHPHQAFRAQQHFRRLDMRMLRELMPPHQGDVAQISRVKEARRELEELFHREMQKESRQFDGWDEYE